MSLADPIRRNAYGFAFEGQILDSAGAPVDISLANNLELRLLLPTGAAVHKAATFTTDGTDGKVRYVVQAGDLDLAGSWQRQFLVSGPAFSFPFEVVAFEVQHNLP